MSNRHVRVVMDGKKFTSTGGYSCDLVLKTLILKYPALLPFPDRFKYYSKDPKEARGPLEQFCNLTWYFPEFWKDDQIHRMVFIFIKRCGNHAHRTIERIIQFNVSKGIVLSMDDLILKPNVLDKSDELYTDMINHIDVDKMRVNNYLSVCRLFNDGYTHTEFR